MSNERDELIQMIWDDAVADRVRDGKDLRNVPVVRPKVEAIADAILAAGYRRPCTITTVEELDALPEFTIVIDANRNVAEKRKCSITGVHWLFTGDSEEYGSECLGLPATVLHEAVTP